MKGEKVKMEKADWEKKRSSGYKLEEERRGRSVFEKPIKVIYACFIRALDQWRLSLGMLRCGRIETM